MIAIETRGQSRVAKLGWGMSLAVYALMVVNGVVLYLVIAPSRDVQTAAILLSGLGLLALVVALEGFRHGSQVAWNALWVVVAVLAVTGAHIQFGGEPTVSVWYAFLAIVALVGQLLAAKGLTS
jgi:hypothetical protein